MGDTLSSTTRHIYYASIICSMQSPQIKLVALVTLAIAPQQGHIILILLFFFFGVVGVVPDDENIVISTNRGETVTGKECLSGQAFSNTGRRIMGEDVPFCDLSGKKSIWHRLFKK